ncbi:hypothetical protein Dimus_011793 [Dionaea muscipula]
MQMQRRLRVAATVAAVVKYKSINGSVKPHDSVFVILRSPASHFCRSICTKFNYADLSSSDKAVVDGLVSVFTRDSIPADADKGLGQLGSQLTTQIVENVLNGVKSWRKAYRFFTWAKVQFGYHHNCYSYNAMASILSRARQNAPLKALALDIVNEQCSMTPGALGFFIRCLGSVGLVDEANLLFDQVKKMDLCYPNNYSYSCLLETICKWGSVDLVEMRYKEMINCGWKADKYVLTPLLQVYCKAGQFEKAWDIFNQIHENGWIDSHCLSCLVLSFSKWGEVDRAFELIERMEDYKVNLNEKTFFVLIHGFVSASRVDKALELFEKMCGLGFPPDIAVYDKLIGGLCETKDVEKALDLYSRMKSSGISPDARIITKLISNATGEEVMVRLLEESGLGDMDTKSMALLYKSILNGLVHNGSIDGAYAVIKRMMGMGDDMLHFEAAGVEKLLLMFDKGVLPNTDCFSVVIEGLYKNGRLDEALELFRDMGRIGCEKTVVLYNDLIDALSCSSNKADECLELFREMKDGGSQPTHFTYNCVYRLYCRQGDVPGALDLLKEMRLYGHKPWIKHSTLLVKQLCKRGMAIEACNFLDHMVRERFLPDIIPYTAAIDGLLKIQEVDRAVELFDSLCARGYRPDVVMYNILIDGLCKAKKVSDAQTMFNEMLEKGLVPSAVTCNSLIDGWCKDGDLDRALVCFSKMAGEEGKEPPPNVVTYTTLMDGLCNAGRPDDAVKLWEEMERKGCSPNRITFIALINGLCNNSEPDSALRYLRDMENRELTADRFVYVALMRAFVSNGNPILASDILKEMIDKGLMLPEERSEEVHVNVDDPMRDAG